MSDIKYYKATRTGVLLRRGSGPDASYGRVANTWTPTTMIADYMIGDEDDVEPLTEAEARQLAPTAFHLG